MTLNETKLFHYAECRVLFIILLNAIMLSVRSYFAEYRYIQCRYAERRGAAGGDDFKDGSFYNEIPSPINRLEALVHLSVSARSTELRTNDFFLTFLWIIGIRKTALREINYLEYSIRKSKKNNSN